GDLPYATCRIVGVVGDSVYRTPREPAQPMIFMPLASSEPLLQKDFYLGARAKYGSAARLERQVSSAIERVNPDLAFSFEPLIEHVDESLSDSRTIALLSALFGALALILAGVGLYGVIAYSVAQRRTEIGVRIALGATAGRIITSTMTEVAAPVGIGIIAGI